MEWCNENTILEFYLKLVREMGNALTVNFHSKLYFMVNGVVHRIY